MDKVIERPPVRPIFCFSEFPRWTDEPPPRYGPMVFRRVITFPFNSRLGNDG